MSGEVWYFDRALEALVFIDSSSSPPSIGAWEKTVWEALGFTLGGVRLLPAVPANVHDALVKNPSAWKRATAPSPVLRHT
jgi:hypothetical protein